MARQPTARASPPASAGRTRSRRWPLHPRPPRAGRAREPGLAAAGRDVIALATQGITAASLATFDRTLADMATNVTATHLA